MNFFIIDLYKIYYFTVAILAQVFFYSFIKNSKYRIKQTEIINHDEIIEDNNRKIPKIPYYDFTNKFSCPICNKKYYPYTQYAHFITDEHKRRIRGVWWMIDKLPPGLEKY